MRSRTKLAAAIASVTVILSPGLAATAAPPSGWDHIAATFREAVERAGIVGASIAFVQGDRIAGRAAVGEQDAATHKPVDEETIFHWASITKTFTGIAIMQLRDRGLLALDEPAIKYVPELRQVHNPYGDMAQVTIRHLMSHASGLRAATWPWGGDQPWHPFEPTRWDQVVAMFPYTELQFRPGTRYSYSNPGVIVLGRIIETLTDDDYEVYVTKNILMPLGMTRTFFDRAPYHLVGHRSHSYVRRDGELKEQRFDFDTGITVSNGGLNAPLGDMAKYLMFLIGDPARGDVYDGVLKRASIDQMFTPQIGASDGEGGSGSDVQAGLSSFIERHLGIELVGHSGDQNGFISHLYLHRPSRSGYIVSFNTDVFAGARRVTREVDDEVRDAIVREYWK